MNTELTTTAVDFDRELESFTQSLTVNTTTLQRGMTNIISERSSLTKVCNDAFSKSKDSSRELKQKIEGIRKSISNIHGDKSRAEKELNEMRQELERLNKVLHKKESDRDRLQQKLTEVAELLAEKEEKVGQMESKKQEVQMQVKKGLDLYQSHLGLTITRTFRNTLFFTFTQVSRSNPETPYMLELTMEEDRYHLLSSNPPLQDLPHIQDRLNATNNLAGCVAYVRASFQMMAQLE